MPTKENSKKEEEKEEIFSFIIPVYGDSGLYLGRCIHSILDQDYPNLEVIAVFDGEDQMKTALKQQDLFADEERVTFFTKEHGGASAARNYGFDQSVGERVCFFDCDSMLRPGAVRTWYQAFKDNPDVDFVYNGYRYTMKDKYSEGMDTKPFNPWLLTCNNYISTMNPIKREKCPKWDESLLGLQDWHFWLEAVHNQGCVGHMIKDSLVITEPPDEEGISGKTHKHHQERYDAVRESIGIPKRTKVISSFGAQFQSMRRAKTLDWDFHDPFILMYKKHDYEAIVSMGYYIDTPMGAQSLFMKAPKDCKKIVHFIGTDVFQLSCKKYRDVKYFAEHFPNSVDHIFCNAPWLQDELADMGIQSELLYCPIDATKYEFKEELPEEFNVAFYRSDSNPMHHEWFMIEIAKSCPDIKFNFFGGTVPLDRTGIPDNVIYHGNIKESNMQEFIHSTSCLIRLTIHDGFPATIAEWAFCGRPSICNLPDMPNTTLVDVQPREDTIIIDKKTVIKALRDLQREPIDVESRKKAREDYASLLHPDAYIKRMNQVTSKEEAAVNV